MSYDAFSDVEGYQCFGGNFYVHIHCFSADGGSRFYQCDGNYLAENI
jgi:hypothetical protein